MSQSYDHLSVVINCVSLDGREFLEGMLESQEQPEDVADKDWDDELAFDACEYERQNEMDLWLYADENIYPERIADAIAQYQTKFNDPTPVKFTWASVCSKPIEGSQGGGAAVIYKGEFEMLDTWTWAMEKLTQMQTT